MAGRNNPTASPPVRLKLKAARKEVGTRQRQTRAIRYKGDAVDLDRPATGICLDTLLKACSRDCSGDRDRALLRVAYETGCRRPELMAIGDDNIEGPDADGSHIDGDALLRRVETRFDGSVRTVGQGAFHPNTITLILGRMIRAAFDKRLLGAMRRGRARAVGRSGIEPLDPRRGRTGQFCRRREPAILQAYRRRDPNTEMRYGAKLAAKSGASARLGKRFAES